MNNYIIPIFVPHLGCPHDCIFCNQRKISGRQSEITSEDVEKIVNQHLETIVESQKDKIIEIAFYGGSFTGIPMQIQEELLEAAHEFIKIGKVDAIRISTRPDYINSTILDMLKKYGVRTIELGVQSMDDVVLKQSYRGHTTDDVAEASKIIKEYGFRLGHQIMIGLPGDTPEKDISTAKEVIGLKPDMVRIYPALVIKGTEMERMFKEGSYNPLSVDEAVGISKQLLKLFIKNDILVIRLGLQTTENINYGKDVVAGPFHPAFKELVESELRYELLSYIFQNMDIKKDKDVFIKVNSREISITTGHKKSNFDKLRNKYAVGKIKISGNNNIEIGQVIVRIANNTISMHQRIIL